MARCPQLLLGLSCILDVMFSYEVTFDTNATVDRGLVEIQTVVPSFLDDLAIIGCVKTAEVLVKNAAALAKFRVCEMDKKAKEVERNEYLNAIVGWEATVKTMAADRLAQISSLEADSDETQNKIFVDRVRSACNGARADRVRQYIEPKRKGRFLGTSGVEVRALEGSLQWLVPSSRGAVFREGPYEIAADAAGRVASHVTRMAWEPEVEECRTYLRGEPKQTLPALDG